MGLEGRWHERISNLAAARAGIPQYVPLFAQMHDHAAWLAGVSLIDYFTNPRTFVETAILAAEYYQFEFPMLVYDAYNIEAEALGQKIVFSDTSFPQADTDDPLIKTPADLAKLKIPLDPRRDGRMPFVLEANQIYKEVTGLDPNLTYCGPLTLAQQIRGFEQFIVDMMTNAPFAHELLSVLTEGVIAPWITALRAEAGGSFLVIGAEAGASLPLITMDMLDEFFVPYVKRLQDLCGYAPIGGLWGESHLKDPTRYIRLKTELAGGRDLSGFDPDVHKLGPEIYKKLALEYDVPLRLGIDGNLIRNGPVNELVERIRRYIGVGAPGGRFLLFLNVIPMDTPPHHVHTAVAAARTFGSYPLAPDLDRISLPDLGAPESFAQFKARMGPIVG